MFFKIIITCNNANSIIKELRPKNGHPHFFSESDLISEEPGALHRNTLRSKGLRGAPIYFCQLIKLGPDLIVLIYPQQFNMKKLSFNVTI